MITEYQETELRTYSLGPAAGGDPEQLVILLHGLGANGQDLLSLAPFFGEVLPHAVFVAPDAPFACDMAPPGMTGSYQWFSLKDTAPERIMSGVLEAAPILDQLITSLIAQYGVTAEKTALIGFSQGTMMSLYAGPRYPDDLAGILGYSGALVWEGDTDFAALNKIPVQLVHGDADQVVPVAAYHEARRTLTQAGFPVEGVEVPGLMHNIDETGIETGKAFLQKILL